MSILQIFCTSTNFIIKISSFVKYLISLSDDTPSCDLLKRFNSNTKVLIEEYVYRLLNFMKVEESTIYLSLIYLNKLKTKQELNIRLENFHKLFLIALSTASKYNEDKIFKNCYYSTVGGIDLDEFNSLEMSFLVLIDFSLFIRSEEYFKYEKKFKSINLMCD